MQPLRNSVVALAQQILAGLDEPERVVSAWPLAVGQATARRTRAVSFQSGTLTVAAQGREWQQQLIALRPQLRQRLERLTGVAVADILFFVETRRVETKPS